MYTLDSQIFLDFDSAVHEVLAFLYDRLGFDLWMVTRREEDHWIILQANDHRYGVQEGSVFRWADSFCSQMVLGKGPRIAPDSDLVPAYASAPIGKTMAIGAYVGVPLVYGNGSLFGTLCAVHPTSQPEAITAELPLIELLAKLLSSLLNSDLKSTEQARCAEQARAEASSDSLSGLYNRRGWDQLLADEEKRCRQYGHPACVISIDLDGLKQVNDTYGHAKGDDLIHRAGQAIRQATRKQDIVARVGGDEFAVLCVECSLVHGEALMERIKTSLALHPIDASLGVALQKPREGLFQAWEKADQAMYLCKRSRRLQNP